MKILKSYVYEIHKIVQIMGVSVVEKQSNLFINLRVLLKFSSFNGRRKGLFVWFLLIVRHLKKKIDVYAINE